MDGDSEYPFHLVCFVDHGLLVRAVNKKKTAEPAEDGSCRFFVLLMYGKVDLIKTIPEWKICTREQADDKDAG